MTPILRPISTILVQARLCSRHFLAVTFLLLAALLSASVSAEEGTASTDRQAAGRSEISPRHVGGFFSEREGA